MTWARLDDSFYDHPKTLRLWERCPAAIALHTRAIAWCAKHEQDGHLPAQIVAAISPVQSDRDEQIKALLDEEAWHEHEGDFVIHDYLDYNPSKEEVIEKRRKDRERKRGGG